jgi:hypothetical protein
MAHRAAQAHIKDPHYVNPHEQTLGLNGFQACFTWSMDKIVEPLIKLALQAERVRQAQNAYFQSGRSDRLLRESKRQEGILDDMVVRLRLEGVIPPQPKNPAASQGGLTF